MASRPESKRRIYIWWQNSVAVGTAIVWVVLAVLIGATTAVDPAKNDTERVVTVVISQAVVTGCGFVAVRSARLGVYWRPGGILIRGLFRTYVVDRDDIRDVQAVLLKDLFRSSYQPRIVLKPRPFVSVMLTEEPTRYRETFELWWLGAVTEAGAQRWIDELTALIRRT